MCREYVTLLVLGGECKAGTSIIQRKIVLLLSNVTSVIKTQY